MVEIRHNEPYTIEDVTLILDSLADGKIVSDVAKLARRTPSGVDNLRAKYKVFTTGVGVVYVSDALKELFKQYDANKRQESQPKHNGQTVLKEQTTLPSDAEVIQRAQQDVSNSIKAYAILFSNQRVK